MGGTESSSFAEPLPWSGVAAVVVTIGSILVATVVSPGFSWRSNALSNLGVTSTEVGTQATVVLFNGGLLAGGVVGVVFGYALLRAATTRAEYAVIGLLALTLALMALVGVFPQGTGPHFPVAGGFYLMVSVSLWADALVRLREGARAWTLTSGVVGTANIAAWVGWIAAGAPWGVAVPEMLGAVLFGAWVCLRSLALAAPERSPLPN
jgi:hypothetical membrane protein